MQQDFQASVLSLPNLGYYKGSNFHRLFHRHRKDGSSCMLVNVTHFIWEYSLRWCLLSLFRIPGRGWVHYQRVYFVDVPIFGIIRDQHITNCKQPLIKTWSLNRVHPVLNPQLFLWRRGITCQNAIEWNEDGFRSKSSKLFCLMIDWSLRFGLSFRCYYGRHGI